MSEKILTKQQIILSNYAQVKQNIDAVAAACGRSKNNVQLLVVTKYQLQEDIIPLLQTGHRLFGENRVQDAIQKWHKFKAQFRDLELHLIGHLQSNKAKEAVQFFDVIESLDSLKLATKLAQEEKQQNKKLKYFIEINLANEKQKSGVMMNEADSFIRHIQQNFNLNVIGLMCIPPVDEDPKPYFKSLQELAHKHKLSQLSMGMSSDYQSAICSGATVVRIGHAIFAE